MVSLAGKRVYLDSSTVIYALEGFSNFSNLSSGLLDGLDAGVISAISSELTLVETVIGPRRTGDLARESVYRNFLSTSKSLTMVPITSAVLETAIDLRSAHSFKVPDAIHIATGLLSGCTAFVTGDTMWSRAGINIIDPRDII